MKPGKWNVPEAPLKKDVFFQLAFGGGGVLKQGVPPRHQAVTIGFRGKRLGLGLGLAFPLRTGW